MVRAALSALVPDPLRLSPASAPSPIGEASVNYVPEGKRGLGPQPLQGALGPESVPVALDAPRLEAEAESSTVRPTCRGEGEAPDPALGSARKRRPFLLCRPGLLCLRDSSWVRRALKSTPPLDCRFWELIPLGVSWISGGTPWTEHHQCIPVESSEMGFRHSTGYKQCHA